MDVAAYANTITFLVVIGVLAYPLYAIAIGVRRAGRELEGLNARLDRYLNASRAAGPEQR